MAKSGLFWHARDDPGAFSGGFGGLLLQATEWGTREDVLHSYELIARYVMPEFQGSLTSLRSSQAWSAAIKEKLQAERTQAMERARADYADQHRGQGLGDRV